MSTSSWQLVLYGRTLRADRWWRVRPRAAALDWLNDVVTTTTSGGEGLERGPRYLLARRDGITIVGGSARASLLSDTMNSDGSRPFYTFVGWLSRDTDAGIPTLQVVEMHWNNWASEEYGAWMPLDWERHQSDLRDAHEPPVRRSPWNRDQELDPASPVARGGEPGAARPRGHGHGPSLFSYDDRFLAWRDVAANRGDAALVVCLPRGSEGSDFLTHVVVPAERERDAEVTPQAADSSAAVSEPPTVTAEVDRADAIPSRAPGSTPAHRPWPSDAREEEPSDVLGDGAFTDTGRTAPSTTDGSGHGVPVRPLVESPEPAVGTAAQPERPMTRRRGFHRFMQKLAGTEDDEAPGASSSASRPAAGNAMANDLEYWRLRQEEAGTPTRPPKRTASPPDNSH